MFRHLLLAGCVTGVFACAGAAPAPKFTTAELAPGDRCVFGAYTVASVQPYFEAVGVKVVAQQLRGVAIRLEAERGLTAEYLRLELARRATHPGPAGGCVLDVAGARASVASDGPGFVVIVRADDERTADELVRRAPRVAAR